MTCSFENFYTLRDVKRWVPLTLTFYVNGHEEKNKRSLMAQ